ncbi:MAG: hypothetical protein ACK5L7_00340 [Paludibacteraceae bacterium]
MQVQADGACTCIYGKLPPYKQYLPFYSFQANHNDNICLNHHSQTIVILFFDD